MLATKPIVIKDTSHMSLSKAFKVFLSMHIAQRRSVV